MCLLGFLSIGHSCASGHVKPFLGATAADTANTEHPEQPSLDIRPLVSVHSTWFDSVLLRRRNIFKVKFMMKNCCNL